MTETIELTERQRERIEAIKQECKEADPGLPKPKDEQIISSLLDTWDAVNDGLYSEDGDEINEAIPHIVGVGIGVVNAALLIGFDILSYLPVYGIGMVILLSGMFWEYKVRYYNE